MTHPEALRHSLTLSRKQGLPFPAAWEIATEDHPLEDFMEGFFTEGRDSEGKDFAEWLRKRWEAAYEFKPHSARDKPTRLEPRNTYAEGLRSLPVASEGPSHGSNATSGHVSGNGRYAEADQATVNHSKRCKSGDRCDREGGHGDTGLFCEHHAGELASIRARHRLDHGFDYDEFNTRTYAERDKNGKARFGRRPRSVGVRASGGDLSGCGIDLTQYDEQSIGGRF